MQLSGDELQVVPVGQQAARNAHGLDDAVMSGPAQAVFRVILDQFDVRFVLRPVNVRVETEIFVAPVGLRMGLRPIGDFVRVDPDLPVLDGGREFPERLFVVVFADAGVEAIVPVVDAADQIVAIDMAIGQQGATVQAAAVEYRDGLVMPDDDEIDLADQRIGGLPVLELGQGFDRKLLHRRPRSSLRRATEGSAGNNIHGTALLSGGAGSRRARADP